jgi:hypothetical protein
VTLDDMSGGTHLTQALDPLALLGACSHSREIGFRKAAIFDGQKWVDLCPSQLAQPSDVLQGQPSANTGGLARENARLKAAIRERLTGRTATIDASQRSLPARSRGGARRRHHRVGAPVK